MSMLLYNKSWTSGSQWHGYCDFSAFDRSRAPRGMTWEAAARDCLDFFTEIGLSDMNQEEENIREQIHTRRRIMPDSLPPDRHAGRVDHYSSFKAHNGGGEQGGAHSGSRQRPGALHGLRRSVFVASMTGYRVLRAPTMKAERG